MQKLFTNTIFLCIVSSEFVPSPVFREKTSSMGTTVIDGNILFTRYENNYYVGRICAILHIQHIREIFKKF